jgi:hypothetical protein
MREPDPEHDCRADEGDPEEYQERREDGRQAPFGAIFRLLAG